MDTAILFAGLPFRKRPIDPRLEGHHDFGHISSTQFEMTSKGYPVIRLP